MEPNLNPEHIAQVLKASGISLTDQVMPALEMVAEAHGFTHHGIYADIASIDGLGSDLAVVVTYADMSGNNGVYLFCIQDTGSVGLMVITPSTVSKGPMINRVTGNIVDAITGIDIPPLTAFDNVEIVGDVIKKLVLDPMMTSLAIPEEMKDLFVTIYMPRFLSNVALQYLGDTELREEIVDYEPHMVKEIVFNEKKDQGDDNVSEDA